VLLCLPHAGGSANFFRSWGELLPEADVYGVRYPGRGERIEEPLARDLVGLARQIAAAAAQLADRPVLLFGHSLGAALALETARALEGLGVLPWHVFASGARHGAAPPPDPRYTEPATPQEVARQLVELGGTDPELASDPDFQELVAPYTLGDTRMFHEYRCMTAPGLHCPITTIAGDADPHACVLPWRALTEGPTREVSVAGDHFYLRGEPPIGLIRDGLPPAGRNGGGSK
jgi:surfactin synthase thioesterase subunit